MSNHTRTGVHGMNANACGRTRLPPLPASTGPYRLFVSPSGKYALEFGQITGCSSEEKYKQEQEYGLPLDGSYATRDDALTEWENINRLYRSGYGHLFGILVYLPDAEIIAETGEQGTAEWLT